MGSTRSLWTDGAATAAAADRQRDGASRPRLRVLHDFEYETRAGGRVRIVRDETLLLVRKTNDDWWQAVRAADLAAGCFVPEHATFYVPTGYVEERPPRQPEAARFYVDADAEGMCAAQRPPAQPQPPRKHSSDSFRSKVIRKLSGQSSTSQPVNGKQQQQSQWEAASAFGMCFGRGDASARSADLNPFQEELESALSHRLSTRRPRPASPGAVRAPEREQPPEAAASFESIQERWQKQAAAKRAALPTIRERRRPPASPERLQALDLINDKRKMWAIETLMSELMGTGGGVADEGGASGAEPAGPADHGDSGARQLAQELHDMGARRRGRPRFEHAEIQVDLPPPPSPKLLDDVANEANILNGPAAPDSPPSYSSVSLRRGSGPGRQARCAELQLSPSLEKLASEIRFLPAASLPRAEPRPRRAACATTISQDSLRLYKQRRSKSEPQLLLAEARQQQRHLRKYAQHERLERGGPRAPQQRPERSLQSKSRSLGDLDRTSRMDEAAEQLRRRYKPVPKLRSKDSFKRLLLLHKHTGPTASAKPVPAKRRVHRTPESSCDDLDQIDIERSTAVGFKSLLRASDSGSEECLQSKALCPSLTSLLPLGRSAQQHSASNDNLSSGRSLSSETILSSASSVSARGGPLDESAAGADLDNLVELPPGWKQMYDANAKRLCFVNARGDKWFSSNDAEGKIYFFEENSNESSWALPVAATTANDNERHAGTMSNGGDWPQLFDGNMCILKEGLVNKTKITSENGRKLRKAWSTSYAVLTELFLLFFKDAKTFAAMKMDQFAAAKPDITVDLNGAFIEPADKLSNRKNVYLVNTLLGLQVLVQSDNTLAIAEWYKEINDAIRKLPFSQECRRSSK